MQVVLPLLEEREAVEEEALCHCLLALVLHTDLPVSCASAVALRLRPRPREEEGGHHQSSRFVSQVLAGSFSSEGRVGSSSAPGTDAAAACTVPSVPHGISL